MRRNESYKFVVSLAGAALPSRAARAYIPGMTRMRAIAALAAGAFIALGLSAQGEAAAQVSATGNLYITNVDGTAIHSRDVTLSGGLHGIAAEYRGHTMSCWCIFYCRIADHNSYRLRAEVQPTGFVRLSLLGGDGVPQVLWAASRPGARLAPARALDVALQSLDPRVIVMDTRLLPGQN